MVLIIGATGFIGTYATAYFCDKKDTVIATGRNEALGADLVALGAQFISLDITDKSDFSKLPTEDIDGVIVLAGRLPANATADLVSEDNAAEYFEVNVIGLINVLEWARTSGVKKVIATSSYADVAGAWGKGYPITEEEPRDFKLTGDHAVYVISKNAATDVMEYYNRQYGMQTIMFRLPPVYGYGPHGTILVNGKPYKSAIQTFIERAQAGQDLEVWGDPETSRDIIYVKDVVRAFDKALDSDRAQGLYNMTSGTALTLRRQAEVVIDVFSPVQGEFLPEESSGISSSDETTTEESRAVTSSTGETPTDGAEAGVPHARSNIVYRPEKSNHTPSFLYSMEKAFNDFGFEPQFRDFREMMIDYKAEMESGWLDQLAHSRTRLENDR